MPCERKSWSSESENKRNQRPGKTQGESWKMMEMGDSFHSKQEYQIPLKLKLFLFKILCLKLVVLGEKFYFPYPLVSFSEYRLKDLEA